MHGSLPSSWGIGPFSWFNFWHDPSLPFRLHPFCIRVPITSHWSYPSLMRMHNNSELTFIVCDVRYNRRSDAGCQLCHRRVYRGYRWTLPIFHTGSGGILRICITGSSDSRGRNEIGRWSLCDQGTIDCGRNNSQQSGTVNNFSRCSSRYDLILFHGRGQWIGAILNSRRFR